MHIQEISDLFMYRFANPLFEHLDRAFRNGVNRFVQPLHIFGSQLRFLPKRKKLRLEQDFDREDAPGLVYAALKPFADAGINLTKIESRPTGAKIGVYYFLIDFDGHEKDDRVTPVFRELMRHTTMFKVLGSYPRAPRPG